MSELNSGPERNIPRWAQWWFPISQRIAERMLERIGGTKHEYMHGYAAGMIDGMALVGVIWLGFVLLLRVVAWLT